MGDKDICRHDFILEIPMKFNEKTHFCGKIKMPQTFVMCLV